MVSLISCSESAAPCALTMTGYWQIDIRLLDFELNPEILTVFVQNRIQLKLEEQRSAKDELFRRYSCYKFTQTLSIEVHWIMGKRDTRVAFVNPIAAARAAGPRPQAGPTIQEYLSRPRPTWEEWQDEQKKREAKSSSLAFWEEKMNEKFREDLKKSREKQLGSSSKDRKEKKSSKKKKKKRERSPSSSSSSYESSDDSDSESEREQRKRRKKNKKEKKKRKRRYSSEDSSDDERKPSKSREGKKSKHKKHRKSKKRKERSASDSD